MSRDQQRLGAASLCRAFKKARSVANTHFEKIGRLTPRPVQSCYQRC